ncbi:MAG: sigma-70 family RNA polymerase sigma factor [Nitrospiraceae bacterium]|nr:MAG: sigma-70 family RNA polymerase sigma factor [Nitrospiraceae bacterium]
MVQRCQRGDTEAYEEIVRKYQKKLFNIAYRMTGDYHEAADVVQDAFIAVYRNIRGFQGRSRFSTWMYTIVINVSRNRMRQVRKRSFHEHFSLDNPVETEKGQIMIEQPSGDLSALERLEKRERGQKVQECMSTLDNEFREVIVLRDIQGFSYDEISEMLNIAEGTVKSRLYRAREKVKEC